PPTLTPLLGADAHRVVVAQPARADQKGEQKAAPDAHPAAPPVDGHAARQEQAGQTDEREIAADHEEAVAEEPVLPENDREGAKSDAGEQVDGAPELAAAEEVVKGENALVGGVERFHATALPGAYRQ